jgi:uncharacterized protein YoxC
MAQISDNEILNAFSSLIQYLPHFFDDKVAFGITDRESFIYEENPEDLPLKIKVGSAISEGGAIFEAIKTGKVIIKEVPKEVYGCPFKSYAVPIRDDNNRVIGCIVVGKSIERKAALTENIKQLSAALEGISSAIGNFSTGVQKTAGMNEDILSKVQAADESSKDTDGILNFIQGIAAQTNMLGLNAAIEASRAGEAGKGFKVVATEIRKLSTSTSESVKQVDSVLKNIGAAIKSINGQITESNEVFQKQAATIQEISAAIEELNATARKLKELSSQL